MHERSANFAAATLPGMIALCVLLASPTSLLAQRTGIEPAPGGPSSDAQPIQQCSPEEVRAEFAALKKEDVAWRKIDWKTCLLDGLKASREQHKPIMLWIFIDRPIDDERC